MEHPVLATDAEMDETSGCKNYPSYGNKLGDNNEAEANEAPDNIDEADAEERALSAMSIFSHDSDDDPTWAPTESEKLKLDQKSGKSEKTAKQINEHYRRKVQK